MHKGNSPSVPSVKNLATGLHIIAALGIVVAWRFPLGSCANTSADMPHLPPWVGALGQTPFRNCTAP